MLEVRLSSTHSLNDQQSYKHRRRKRVLLWKRINTTEIDQFEAHTATIVATTRERQNSGFNKANNTITLLCFCENRGNITFIP